VSPDIVNGLFELIGGLFILNHCRVLYQHKQVKGVSIVSTMFFSAWGFWNLFFYPHLEQMWSFAGGVVIVVANCLWIGLMLYYAKPWHTVEHPSSGQNNNKKETTNALCIGDTPSSSI
jgi:hypothetical protein